jgi:hypothetical protein
MLIGIGIYDFHVGEVDEETINDTYLTLILL